MRLTEAAGALLAMAACNVTPPQPLTLEFPPPDADAGLSSDAGSADVSFPPGPDADAPLDAARDVWSPPVPVRDADLGVGLDATDLDAPGPDPPALACDADGGASADGGARGGSW